MIRRLARSILRARAAPALPERKQRAKLEIGTDPVCVYAIGDIHGCIDKLRRLEEAIVADAASIEGSKLLVYLGDYIDRGTASAAVVEHLLAPPPAGFHRVCLCGNHEAVLIDVVDGRRSLEDWLHFGGERTLLSYGYDLAYMAGRRRRRPSGALQVVEAVPERHLAFLRQLPSAFSTPSFTFVHAGLRPGVPLADQRDEDLLWIRPPDSVDASPASPRLVVHGHTPTTSPVVDSWRIGVDTGAYMGGPLTAVRLMQGTILFLDDR